MISGWWCLILTSHVWWLMMLADKLWSWVPGVPCSWCHGLRTWEVTGWPRCSRWTHDSEVLLLWRIARCHGSVASAPAMAWEPGDILETGLGSQELRERCSTAQQLGLEAPENFSCEKLSNKIEQFQLLFLRCFLFVAVVTLLVLPFSRCPHS